LEAADKTLICVDAPLGWPVASQALALHRAGEEVATPRQSTFDRETDRAVADLVKRRPLRIGADRIAATAHCRRSTTNGSGSGIKARLSTVSSALCDSTEAR
jgi:hypothetical protein